jgi:zinc protease
MHRLVVTLVLISVPAFADDLPKGPRLTEVPYEVQSTMLPSGALFILEKDPSRPLAMVATVVDVGAADDPPGQEGLAHLVEHLAFRTRTDGKRPYTDLLEITGAGAWNAFTSHDVTVFYSAGSAAGISDLLRAETARLLDPLKGIDAQTFDVEREVVRAELRQRNERGRISAVDTALAAALYPKGHPYSRPISGTETSLTALTLEQARAFAATHYRPEKMTLLVAGDVDPAGMPALLQGSVAAPFLTGPGTAKTAPSRLGPERPPPELPEGPVLRKIKAAAPVPTLHIAWSLPRGFDKDGHLQTFAFRTLPGALLRAFKDEDLLDISGSLERGKLGSTLVISVDLAEGKSPEKALEQLLDQIIRLWMPSNHNFADPSWAGPADLQLRLGMGRTIVREALASESLLDRDVQRAQTAHFTGDPSYLTRQMKSLGTMAAGDLSRFAFEWLSRSRARAVYVQPDGSVETEGSTAAVFASVSSLKLSVPPEMISQRVKGPGATVRSTKLANGLEVVVARRASGPVVAVTLAARGGSADADPLGAANLAAFAGVRDGRHGLVDTVGMSEYQWSDPATSYDAYEGASGNLSNALARLFDVVDSSRVGAGTDAVVATYVRKRSERMFELPSAKAARQIRAAVFKGTPLGRTASPQDIAGVGPGDANAWADRTWTPANSVLTIVGDVDPDVALLEAQSWMGGWKRAGKVVPPPGLPAPRAPTDPIPMIGLERADAQQSTLRVACVVPIKTPEDFAAVHVLAERMEMRLHQTSRLVLGATYGFGSSVTLSRGLARLQLEGAVEERGLARVSALMKRDADALGKEPVTADELGRLRWREGIASAFRHSRSLNLSRALADLRLSGLPEDTFERYPATLVALTPEAVTAAGAECRKNAVIQLVAPRAVLLRAGTSL